MRYRKEIDGLRALAVLPVVFFHAGISFVSGGFVGVDIFFVISGFLITTNIIAEKEAGSFSLLTFYERRIRRILPALFVVMACCIPLAWLWLLPNDLRSFSQSLIAASTLVPNYFFYRTSGYFDTTNELKPLLHTWSLGVEEQYYLIFPLLILVLWRFGKWRIWWMLALIGLTSLILAQWISSISPTFSFYMLPTRGWEILVGALAAIYLRNQTPYFHASENQNKSICEAMSLLGVLLIVYAVLTFDNQTPMPGIYALIPTMGAVLLLVCATNSTFIGKALASRALVGIGLISYSLYLWHQPLLAFARYRLVEPLSTAMTIAILMTTLGLAFLSWKYVERPFRDKKLIVRKSVFISSSVLAAAFIVVGAVGVMSKGMPSRMPDAVLQAMEKTELDGKLRDDGGCNLQKNEYAHARCIKGAKQTEPQFVLMGDSHAAILAHELGAAFEKAGISFMQRTKNSCPFARGLTMSSSNNCDKYLTEYLKEMNAAQGPNTYIIASRWSYYAKGQHAESGGVAISRRRFSAGAVPVDASEEARGRSIIQSYVESISFLLGTGKKVILIYPIPAHQWDVPRRWARTMTSNEEKQLEISIEYALVVQQDAAIAKAFDALGLHENLTRIRPDKILCNTFIANRCVATDNERLLYIDDNHLSNHGARLIVEEIMHHLENPIAIRSED